MKKILLTALLSGFVGTASAQSAFEGFYGQVGIGYQSTKPSMSGPTFQASSGFGSTIGAGYTFSIDKTFMLGVGAEYSPIPSSSSTFTGEGGATGSYKNQNTYNIFISPGVAIGKDALAYAKVGYTGTSLKFADGTNNLTGYSVGLGYKQIISGGLYGFAEGNYLGYSNKTFTDAVGPYQLKANSMNLLVGVGYKF